MKELKICRREKDRFTVVVTEPDFSAFPHYGFFPDIYHYYRVDSEYELIALMNRGEELHPDGIETIYYGNLDVTDKYIQFD